MTPKQIEDAGRLLYGDNWRKGLVQNTGLSRTHLARVLRGAYPLPEGIAPVIETLLAVRMREIGVLFTTLTKGVPHG